MIVWLTWRQELWQVRCGSKSPVDEPTIVKWTVWGVGIGRRIKKEKSKSQGRGQRTQWQLCCRQKASRVTGQWTADALKTEVNWWVESEDGKALKQTATLMAPRYVHRAYVHVCMCAWVQVSPPREGGKFLWERSKWSKKANWHQGHMRNVNSPISHRVLLLCLLKDDRQEQFPTNWLYLDPLKNHLGWEKESICTVPPRDASDERLSGTLCHGLSDKGVSLTLVTLPLIMNPPKLRTFWN